MKQFEKDERVKVRTNTHDQCIGQVVEVNVEKESATIKVLKVISGSFFKAGTTKTVSMSSLSILLSKEKLRYLVKTQLIDAANLLLTHESAEFMSNIEKEELSALKEKVIAAIRQSFAKNS